MSDLVATWDIALSDGVHKVEFEHGTTTGKRIIRVDGKVAIFLQPVFFIFQILLQSSVNIFILLILPKCK